VAAPDFAVVVGGLPGGVKGGVERIAGERAGSDVDEAAARADGDGDESDTRRVVHALSLCERGAGGRPGHVYLCDENSVSTVPSGRQTSTSTPPPSLASSSARRIASSFRVCMLTGTLSPGIATFQTPSTGTTW